MMNLIYVFLPSVVAGIIQSTTGFGSGVFMMLFFPLFMDMLPAAGLSCLISLACNTNLVMRYRKHIQVKSTLWPLVIFFIVSFCAVKLALVLPVSSLKAYFGLFLVGLAIYFVFFSDRIQIQGGPLSIIVCSVLSGLGSGFFGISGPPMVIYFLAMAGDDKKKYIGTIQFFFMITGLYVTTVRILEGVVTWTLLWPLIAGAIGIVLGNIIGTRILDRINVKVMKKLIYIFLALSGTVTFLSNI